MMARYERRAVLLSAAAVAAAPTLGTVGSLPDPADELALVPAVMRYAWGLDTLDPREALATFAPDAVIHDAEGRRWNRANGGAPAFLARALASATPGGQHHIQINRIVATGRRYRVESYWSRVAWQAGAPRPALTAMGTFVDTLARRGGDWLIVEKRVALWNSATVRVPPVVERGS